MVAWKTRVGIAGLCTVALTLPAGSQTRVVGTVRGDSSGRPLPGVGVVVEDSRQAAHTDSAGRYVLDVPTGRLVLDFQIPGYQPLRLGVWAHGDSVRADAMLVRTTATQLDTVAVNEQSHGSTLGRNAFGQRRHMGFGKFVDSTALRSRDDRRLDDVLRELAGVKFQDYEEPGANRSELRAVSPFKPAPSAVRGLPGSAPCWVSVFLNGTSLYRSDRMVGGRPPDFSRDFSVADLESVEYYRTGSEVPQQFGGSNANCGALLLWTRR
jgi:carboxypeptidase family protein